MADVEPYIASVIIQLANMGVPFSTAQGLQLCNSKINKGLNMNATFCNSKRKT
jgi:hypothetical protein